MGTKPTSQVTSTPNPQASAAYQDVVGKAQQVASTPYQPYTGELVAGLNAGQNTAVGQLAGAYGAATPWIAAGTGDLRNGIAGLGNVQNYLQAGSDAAAGLAPFQAAASNEIGQGNTLVDQAAQAYGGVGQYQDLARGAFGQETAGLGAAQGYFGQAAGLATPQDFASNVGTYENPFTSDVINTTMAEAAQADHAQASNLASNEIGSGAYGGDRGGIAQAALAGQQDMANNSTIAGLNQADFAQATQEFNAVQGQRLQGAGIYAGLGAAATQNALGYGQAGAGYAGLGQLQGQVAQGLGNLGTASAGLGAGYAGLGQLSLGQAGEFGSLGQLQGTTGQAYGSLGSEAGNLGGLYQGNLVSGASAGLQAGTLEQQNQQQTDTAAYNQYMAGLSYPYQNVGFLSNIVQGIGSQEGNTQTTQGNALSQIAGLGTAGIGLLGMTGNSGVLSGGISSIGNALTGLGSGLVSDARAKDNIAPVGQTFDGQPIYRYNYKGDDKTQIGLMAQDVERRDPGAIGQAGPFKTVDYDRATRGAALMGLGATPEEARRLHRADGGRAGLGLSPVGGPTMPGALLAGLGARPRFDDGGAAAPVPAGGFATNGIPGGGGLNMSPTALMGGSTLMAHAPQPGFGPRQGAQTQGLGAVAQAPQTQTAGLGASPAAGGFGSQGDSSGGLSPNAWMGVLSAGLGMMGGTSMSGLANIGAGAQQGLQTYLGLQQRDVTNAQKQQELALDKERADSQAAYQQGSLGIQSKDVDLRVKQVEAEIANEQRQAAIDSANSATLAQNANTTASATASENATREQQRQLSRYQQFYVPGVGGFYRDLTNPGAPPVPIGTGPGSPGASAGSAPPPPSPQATSPLTASAPPPQGGVPASGVGATAVAAPASLPTQAPPPMPSAPPGGVGSRPQAGSSLSAVQVPQAWQPTTTVPQGFVPSNSMNIAMSSDGGKSQAEIGQKEVEGLQTNAAKATNAQAQLYQMNAAVDGLPKSGLIAPGTFGDERAKIALGLNTIAQSVGAQPVIDPDKVADLQEVQKIAFRLGTSMIADTNGAREAGFILQRSTQNVPSLNNNYLGFKRVAAGIDQANQYAIDKANFVSDYYAKYHHTDGADALFSKLNPWQNYAQRAIDTSTMPTTRPGNVPQGSQYSMSAQMWRDPQGNIYGRDGQAVSQ